MLDSRLRGNDVNGYGWLIITPSLPSFPRKRESSGVRSDNDSGGSVPDFRSTSTVHISRKTPNSTSSDMSAKPSRSHSYRVSFETMGFDASAECCPTGAHDP